MSTDSGLPEKHRFNKTATILIAVGCIFLVLAFVIGISDNPPGIVAMLAGFFAVVLGIFNGVAKGGRRKPAYQLLYWSPRALCIVFALFISMFRT